MSKALQNLKKYTDSLIHGKSRGGYSTGCDVGNLELCWDSWDQTTPAVSRHAPSRNYHDPKHHRSIVSSNRRDESASPKQVKETILKLVYIF